MPKTQDTEALADKIEQLDKTLSAELAARVTLDVHREAIEALSQRLAAFEAQKSESNVETSKTEEVHLSPEARPPGHELLVNFESVKQIQLVSGNWGVARDNAIGRFSVSSKKTDPGGSSEWTLALDAPIYSIEFAYAVDSEQCCDFLSFEGQRLDHTGGEWRTVVFDFIEDPRPTVTWAYQKDGGTQVGRDKAWVDNIRVYTSLEAAFDADRSAAR
jgi:hypothetical protein